MVFVSAAVTHVTRSITFYFSSSLPKPGTGCPECSSSPATRRFWRSELVPLGLIKQVMWSSSFQTSFPNHHSSTWKASFAWKMYYLWSTFVSDTGWVNGREFLFLFIYLFIFFQEGNAVTLPKQIGYWVTGSDTWGGRSSSCPHPQVLYQAAVVWIHNGWSLVFNIDWTVCVCVGLGILWIIWMRPHLNPWMRDYSKKPRFLSKF